MAQMAALTKEKGQTTKQLDCANQWFNKDGTEERENTNQNMKDNIFKREHVVL